MTFFLLGLLIGFCLSRAIDAVHSQPKERVRK